ncbi:hypothetical protein [Qipengyuania spongiae]|uniref:Uncharacterized protein n=1 Tax=Qipengyuania spongiae TaxID=2909673 RepID=A0ABY5SV14_9SPHN|nr:hypothetical protein [Qipengyuania spongiae]UVI38393.1 hypothetical protein L1F33_08975 [Qipengyuania spongiae]
MRNLVQASATNGSYPIFGVSPRNYIRKAFTVGIFENVRRLSYVLDRRPCWIDVQLPHHTLDALSRNCEPDRRRAQAMSNVSDCRPVLDEFLDRLLDKDPSQQHKSISDALRLLADDLDEMGYVLRLQKGRTSAIVQQFDAWIQEKGEAEARRTIRSYILLFVTRKRP